MAEKKEDLKKDSEDNQKVNKIPDFIKWFSELNKNSGKVVGGKGANLGEIYNLKVLVPPGFVVTAQAYDYFINKAQIEDEIKELLKKIEYENTDQLNETTKEIRDHIEKAEFPKEMEEDILEAYETLGAEESGMKSKQAHDIIKKSPEAIFVAVRSSATTEDLAEASFAGQQDTFLNVKGKTDLLVSIKKCFASLFTPRATYYRNKKGFKHEQASLSVIIQKMVDADKSGVIFSKDPSLKKENVIIEAVWGLGEGIVSGQISPDRYIVSEKSGELVIQEKVIGKKKIAITRDSSGKKEIVKLKEEISERQVLKEHEIKKLAEIALKLERHYQKPQDIEFAIENGEIYIVQTRPITTLENRAEAGAGLELKGELILKGLAASPGIGSGKIKIIKDLKDLGKIIKGDILVTTMTNPDMVVTMQKCAAIVTDEGGLTAHAAIVSREMGIPAIVGTQEATTKLKEGEIITVDGFSGRIYKGKIAESAKKEVLPVTAQTKTKIKVILDLPSFASRAAKTKLKGIGLTRLEGIIAESGKHPKYFLEKNALQDYEEIIFKGIREIAQYFEEIWIRTSDIRTDEFQNLEGAPKEVEANPMLGMHGIRYGIKYPEILKAELRAMKRISDKGKKIGILSPQVISVQEIKKLKEFSKEIGFDQIKIGVMIETPASVQLIKEFCEEKIDFISFGTNDLTQYTLAIDRGNQEVQSLYNELDHSILYQIEHVIKICKEYNVETSICGQAGSQKEMVKFLVEKGIDSISVNADVAANIANYVSELEGKTTPQEEEQKQEEAFVKPEYTAPKEETLETEAPTQESEEEFPTIRGGEPIQEPEEKQEEPEEKSEYEIEPEKEPIKEVEQEESELGERLENISKEQPEDQEPTISEKQSEPEPAKEKEEEKSEEKEEILDIF
ncbi:MAG TPA: phosphoenolpyruvate synthase [Bacillota bacterium]|nr:phosphoenolpyruvate synthase [Bacillota bacterium]